MLTQTIIIAAIILFAAAAPVVVVLLRRLQPLALFKKLLRCCSQPRPPASMTNA
jgi:hypothetical protein